MNFIDEVQKQANVTETENGGKAYSSSLSSCLDFFALGAAKRNHIDDAVLLFEEAYAEEKSVAVKILFYIRDVRGGCGERSVFRACFSKLHEIDPLEFNRLLKYVPTYGRWDDLFAVPITEETIEVVKNQLTLDLESDSPSLLAKWLPSENTSSKTTRILGSVIRNGLGYSKKEYQKILSSLRKKLNLLENSMTFSKWDEIKYDKLPGQAFRKHVSAFHRHDKQRFEAFLNKVSRGEKTINTDTIYCYEVLDMIKNGNEEAANAVWDNLPEYTEKDALVVADVSGSMQGRPMDIAVSLALYFAEMCKGPFKNKFITFSQKPQLVDIKGSTLSKKLRFISQADWGMNTNLQAVFDLILSAAVNSGAKQSEMPSIIYIISDMEFDECVFDNGTEDARWGGSRAPINETVFENAKRNFSEKGYELPTVVFWNCDARENHLPATKFDDNVALVSGASQSIFQIAVEGKNPTDVMLEVINSSRYKTLFD